MSFPPPTLHPVVQAHPDPACPYHRRNDSNPICSIYPETRVSQSSPETKPFVRFIVGRISKGVSGDPSTWMVNQEPRCLVEEGIKVELISSRTKRSVFLGRIQGCWVLEKRMLIFWMEGLSGRIAYLAVPHQWAHLHSFDRLRWALGYAFLPDTLPTLPDSLTNPVRRWRDNRSHPVPLEVIPCRCALSSPAAENPYLRPVSDFDFDSEEEVEVHTPPV